jgi:probable O-glycosylation ligase (exosortase A-associated)
MLRVGFIFSILFALMAYALRGPVEALVLYLWLAYFRPENWVWTPFIRTLPLSLLAGLYLLVRLGLSPTRFRFDLRVALLFTFLAICIVSAAQSRYFEVVAAGMLSDVTKIFIVSYMMALLAISTDRIRTILVTIVLSVGFEQTKQGWVTLLTSPGSRNDNGLPIFGDNNGVAGGMMMLVPILLVLARTAKTKYEKWLFWFMAVGMLYRGLSTYSRGGFLAAIAMALVFIWRSPKRVPAFAGFAVVAVLISGALPQEYWDRMNSVKGKETQDGNIEFDKSAAGRLFFWGIAMRMANANVFGAGPGAFTAAYNAYDTTDGWYGRNRAVHSAWFGAIGELGYPGLLFLVVNILVAWFTTARTQRLAARGQIPKEMGIYASGFEAALIAYCVAATFLNFHFLEMLWHMVALTIALHWNTQDALLSRSMTPGTEAYLMSRPIRPNVGTTVRRVS